MAVTPAYIRMMAWKHIGRCELDIYDLRYEPWQLACVYCSAHGFLGRKQDVFAAEVEYRQEMETVDLLAAQGVTARSVLAWPHEHETVAPYGAEYVRLKQVSGEDLGVARDFAERYANSVDKRKGVPWEAFCLRRWIEIAVQKGTEIRESEGGRKTYDSWEIVQLGCRALVMDYLPATATDMEYLSVTADAGEEEEEDLFEE